MKKKQKLILLCFISTFLTFIIYFYTKNDELTLVSLGDSLSIGMTPYDIEGLSFNDYLEHTLKETHKLKKYIPSFSKNNQTIKDLIYEIKENKTITFKNEQIEIKRAINEADILTLAIGTDELSTKKITKEIKEEFQLNFTELLKSIANLNYNKVIVLSLYNTKNKDILTTNKLNAIIRDITLTHNFIFLDINELLKDQDIYFNQESYYLNYKGHKKISKEIQKYL